MDDFLNGNLDEMIDNLIAVDRAEKLQGGEEEQKNIPNSEISQIS